MHNIVQVERFMEQANISKHHQSEQQSVSTSAILLPELRTIASSMSASSRSCLQSLSGACQNSWNTCTFAPDFDVDVEGDDDDVTCDV